MPFSKVLGFFFQTVLQENTSFFRDVATSSLILGEGLRNCFGLAELLLLSLKFYITMHFVYIPATIPFQLHGRCICLIMGVFSDL